MRGITIGEVLSSLKDEFDDVTISKIRFLEAEGLIRPDRTEAGYRTFSDVDIDRLRYVLRAQRDRYLPLKVIKDELERMDAGVPVTSPLDDVVEESTDDVPAPRAVAAPSEPSLLDLGPTDVALSSAELGDAVGLTEADLAALREHAILRSAEVYDGDDLQIARAAAALLQLGLEPRHLRMYGQFADREVALYQQLITPLLRQRNPDSRRTATDQLEELARHGARLHRSVLARELRSLLRP